MTIETTLLKVYNIFPIIKNNLETQNKFKNNFRLEEFYNSTTKPSIMLALKEIEQIIVRINQLRHSPEKEKYYVMLQVQAVTMYSILCAENNPIVSQLFCENADVMKFMQTPYVPPQGLPKYAQAHNIEMSSKLLNFFSKHFKIATQFDTTGNYQEKNMLSKMLFWGFRGIQAPIILVEDIVRNVVKGLFYILRHPLFGQDDIYLNPVQTLIKKIWLGIDRFLERNFNIINYPLTFLADPVGELTLIYETIKLFLKTQNKWEVFKDKINSAWITFKEDPIPYVVDFTLTVAEIVLIVLYAPALISNTASKTVTGAGATKIAHSLSTPLKMAYATHLPLQFAHAALAPFATSVSSTIPIASGIVQNILTSSANVPSVGSDRGIGNSTGHIIQSLDSESVIDISQIEINKDSFAQVENASSDLNHSANNVEATQNADSSEASLTQSEIRSIIELLNDNISLYNPRSEATIIEGIKHELLQFQQMLIDVDDTHMNFREKHLRTNIAELQHALSQYDNDSDKSAVEIINAQIAELEAELAIENPAVTRVTSNVDHRNLETTQDAANNQSAASTNRSQPDSFTYVNNSTTIFPPVPQLSIDEELTAVVNNHVTQGPMLAK